MANQQIESQTDRQKVRIAWQLKSLLLFINYFVIADLPVFHSQNKRSVLDARSDQGQKYICPGLVPGSNRIGVRKDGGSPSIKAVKIIQRNLFFLLVHSRVSHLSQRSSLCRVPGYSGCR